MANSKLAGGHPSHQGERRMPTQERSTGRPTVSRSSMAVTGISGSLEERGPVTRLPDPVPGELWCPIISGDDHVLEPPNMFEGRVPRRFADSVPNLVEDEDGIPFWAVGDGHIPIMIGNGSIGRPSSEWNNVPQMLEDFRPGVTDPAARLPDMDLNGVWASMCFPSLVWGFAGRVFAAFRGPRPRAGVCPGLQRLDDRGVVRDGAGPLHPLPDAVAGRSQGGRRGRLRQCRAWVPRR